jgi:hypothetical protein
MSAASILSTTTYYARSGEEQKLYDAVAAQNQILAKNHLQTYTLFRGAGGSQPAVFWEMTFPNMAAHDAWFKHANTMVETAAQKAIDNQADAATLRVQHAHYFFHNGFDMNPSECK